MDNKETMLGRLMSVLVSLPKEMLGTLMDLARKLSGGEGKETHKMLKKMLRGELTVSKFWWTIDADGVIHLFVTGLGLTGPEMGKHLVSEGHKVSYERRTILNSPDYVPAEKGKVYHLAILPGKMFSDEKRTMENIRAEGDRRGLIYGRKLPTEIGALIVLNFFRCEIEEMGLSWLTTLHEPVKDSDGNSLLLNTFRQDCKSWLYAAWDKPGNRWYREIGFVFGVSYSSQG